MLTRPVIEPSCGPDDAWKQDVFRYVCSELGLSDPWAYAERVQRAAAVAVEAACATPRDFSPAKQFGREHSGLLLGLTVSTVLTGGVPLLLLLTGKVLHALDANSDEMLRPGWAPRWFRANVSEPFKWSLDRARRRMRWRRG
jgi:hypothetical protein